MGGKATLAQGVPEEPARTGRGEGWQQLRVLLGAVALAEAWPNLVKIKSEDTKLESGGNTPVWYWTG